MMQRVAKVQKPKNMNLDKWGFFYKCKIQNLKCCKTYALDELRNIRHFAQDQIYTSSSMICVQCVARQKTWRYENE